MGASKRQVLACPVFELSKARGLGRGRDWTPACLKEDAVAVHLVNPRVC